MSGSEPAAEPEGSRTRVMAWGLFVAATGLYVGGTLARLPGALDQGRSLGWILGAIATSAIAPAFAFAIAGLLVGLRRPDNPAGWLMLIIAIGWSLTALPGATPSLPYLSAMAWTLPFGLMGTHLLLRLPDGHLPSPGWRWVSRGSTLSIALAGTFLPTEDGLPFTPGAALGLAGLLALLVCILLSVASLFVRRRRADAEQRHQLRWIATGAAVFFGVYLLSFIPGILGLGQGGDLGGLVFLGIRRDPGGDRDRDPQVPPVGHRRRDSEGVGRGGAGGVLHGCLRARRGWCGALVGATSTTGLSFVAAALVAVGLHPVLARARRFADRFVYGKRATPYEVLAEFSERVGETYADDEVLQHMARVVADGIGASQAIVWIRVDDRLRVAARLPADGGVAPVLAMTGDTLPDIPGTDASFPVEHQGELLGALSVTTPPNDPMDPAKTRLVGDLAVAGGAGAPQRPAEHRLAVHGSRSFRPRRSAWSRPRTRSVASSSATSTTAPSSSSSPWP